VGIIINGELGGIWKELVTTYLKVLFQHLKSWTEEKTTKTKQG
jgi:hypothetical protein